MSLGEVQYRWRYNFGRSTSTQSPQVWRRGQDHRRQVCQRIRYGKDSQVYIYFRQVRRVCRLCAETSTKFFMLSNINIGQLTVGDGQLRYIFRVSRCFSTYETSRDEATQGLKFEWQNFIFLLVHFRWKSSPLTRSRPQSRIELFVGVKLNRIVACIELINSVK